MKSTVIACAIAASLGFGSVAFAQSYERSDGVRQGYDQRNQDQRYDAHRRDSTRRDHMGNNVDSRDGQHRGNYANGERGYYGERGYNGERDYNAHSWRRGSRIPDEYRNRQYVVNDWHGHGLRQPPRGYQWVQVGSDYVMVAIASGIIAQLLINQ